MTFLDVPFREKDQVKALGARWDAVSKRWYVPEALSEDLDLFQKWLLPQSGHENISNNLSNHATSNERDLYSHSLDFNTPQESLSEQKGSKLSVVLRKIQMTLRQGFPGGVWIVAEIANINTRRGHVYLELTETNEQGQAIANCRAMIWQSQANNLLDRFNKVTGSSLAIGQKVLLLAEVNFHEQYGFSFVVQDLDPSYTLGEQEQRLNEIRLSLIKKGFYQENKRFDLPADYFRIAVIAPPEAAGLGDFRADADVLQKNKLCQFNYFYSSFQGEKVEPEMLEAISAVHSMHQTKPFDALVVIRGGGAKLDLNMLNIESVAEALCRAQLPVLSGIGHERDNTILDEVAHSRFDTPSKVIGFIKNQIVDQAKNAHLNWVNIEQSSRLKVQNLRQKMVNLHHSITRDSLNNVHRWQQKLEPISFNIRRLSESKIRQVGHNLDVLYQQIQSKVNQQITVISGEVEQQNKQIHEAARRAVAMQKQQLIQSISFILSSGPKAQLNRGFSMAKGLDNKPIVTAKEALNHDEIELEFSDGSIRAKIPKNQDIKQAK
ncbi:exodeoxyribonuclease VII large subunit [Thiomicrorhabdus sp.]|uniref:exodeoxyribonuclease VII large subunit n=1 Tax=Thiomicrorhabdus sp. TaxID=2039724 RepID=UPI002AA794B7|nr:exodeoxyribonuclease VII large subunit [Thiomicrorhabdus sp.]